MEGHTRFGPVKPHSSASLSTGILDGKQTNTPYHQRNDDVKGRAIVPLHEDPLLKTVDEMLDRYGHYADPTERDDRERFNNLYNCWCEGTAFFAHISEPIISLLGARSKAASIILSHALVNGNKSLFEELFGKRVPLTLEHVKIALKVGYPLSKRLFDRIRNGASFQATFESAVGESDVLLLSQKGNDGARVSLTSKEQNYLEALVQSRPSRYALYINIDRHGTLRASCAANARANVVQHIPTATPKAVLAPEGTSSDRPISTNARIKAASEEPEANPRFAFRLAPHHAPTSVRKSELDRRLRSLELWHAHLDVLLYHEERKFACLGAWDAIRAQGWKRTDAHAELCIIVDGLKSAAEGLRSAVPA